MKVIINVSLVCLLFVCTFADKFYESNRCREYKKAVIPATATDAPELKIYDSNTNVHGTFQAGNHDRIIAYELQAKGNSPSLCLNSLDMCGKKMLCKTYGFVQKVTFMHYDPDEDTNNEGRVFVIRVTFGQKENDHKIVIVDVPVFATADEKHINGMLDGYLRDLSKQRGRGITTHKFDWAETALKSPAKLYKDRSRKTDKVDTYFAHCQYVPQETLRNIIVAFGWTKN